MIRVMSLSKRLSDQPVLAALTFEVAAGTTLGILGPSGCGKTTLLRILAGFEHADQGSVYIEGQPVLGPGPRVCLVAQGGTLFPWLSLRNNLAFGPRVLGRTRGECTALVDALLTVTGLTEAAHRLPRELSGGMRQRAAIAQVIATQPAVLLLDEPFGALDAQTRTAMHEWVLGLLAAWKTTTIIVTHDTEEALLLSHRVLLLSARPARVRLTLDVAPSPEAGCSWRTLTDPAFVAQKRLLLDRLHDTPADAAEQDASM
jgi:NitT/TauT family transport system ATP-binding protein